MLLTNGSTMSSAAATAQAVAAVERESEKKSTRTDSIHVHIDDNENVKVKDTVIGIREWMYQNLKSGEKLGPLSIVELYGLYRAGEFTKDWYLISIFHFFSCYSQSPYSCVIKVPYGPKECTTGYQLMKCDR
jgi:hypothetical protein